MSTPTRINNKKRILILFIACGFVFFVLGIRLGWIMLVDGDEYSDKAVAQQTKDTPISADRGKIYDRNMKELAVNAPSYTVWVRPAELKDKKGDVSKMAQILSEITDQDAGTISASLQKESALVKIARNVKSSDAEKIRKYMSQGALPGISVDENIKRYYPYDDFASTVIGHTSDDNVGVSGLELFYNNYLSGKSGRIIKNTDASGRQLSYGTEKYYEPENGLNLVLTIDEVIQHYLDKSLINAYNDTGCKKTMGIAMNPNTGEILAMSMYPGYNLNDPRTPLTEEAQEEYSELKTDSEKTEYWNKMWRNFMVSDTYEPGSTFKLITTAIALEENITNINDTFTCTGYYKISSDVTLRCWRYYNPHGVETLAQAVQNSCNPVFVGLGLKIGAEKYHEYLENLGFTTKTGIDLPGETVSIIYDKDDLGLAELGTMSYGHGISVTPIQLINAISSVVNGGYLRTPHIVKEIQNNEGTTIFKNETKVIRRTFSEKTSKEMREIMQSVVDEGTGKKGYIPGYRIGGKTGTADKVVNGKYAAGKVYCSFISIAPSDNPEIITLFIVDEPEGAVHYASTVAVPYVRDFLEDTLAYMQVEPKYSDDELTELEADWIEVKDVTGNNVKDAVSKIEAEGFKVEVVPDMPSNSEKVKVVDQYPKAGTKVKSGTTVFIYTE